jgi:hypothetical protein
MNKTIYYLFISDESFIIKNQIQFNLKCALTGLVNRDVIIKPLQKIDFLNIDQSKSQLKIYINYDNNVYLFIR